MSYILFQSFLDSISTFLSDFFLIFESKKNSKILFLGLDNAGKSTLFHKLKFNELTQTQPTIGFYTEQVTYKNITFTVYDIGGQSKNRYLWRSYLEHSDALIFVVDSSDKERFPEIKKEIFELDKEEILKDTVFLILANKQDLETAEVEFEVFRQLDLDNLSKGRKWHVQPTSFIRNEDDYKIYEGLEWLKKNITWQQINNN